MKEKYIFISLLLLMSISLQPFYARSSIAAESSYLAIEPLKTNLVDKELLIAISSHVRNYVVTSYKYEIVEKNAAIKKGAGLLLSGSLVKLGSKVIINLRLIDLDTGEVIKKSRESSSQEELLKGLEKAVTSLIGISGLPDVSGLSGKKAKPLSIGFGFLHLKSNPPGASIVLDGEGVGVTPRTIEALKSGKYVVKLIKDGYFLWKKEVSIAGGSVVNLMAELKTIYGTLDINSSPAGAAVFIDGDFVGETPFKADKLEGGEHKVKVDLEGYESFTDIAKVYAGGSHEMLALLNETEVHRQYRLARKKRIKKQAWAFGSLSLSAIMAAKSYVDYSDSEDAYSSADDAYLNYKNSFIPSDIDKYRNLTKSYKKEGASKAEDGDDALMLSSAFLALSIYNFYTMPEKAEYSETAFVVPEIRGDVMFLALKKRY